jgi:hypothetical protein
MGKVMQRVVGAALLVGSAAIAVAGVGWLWPVILAAGLYLLVGDRRLPTFRGADRA